MNNTENTFGKVEEEVLSYYRRNWESIVNCYKLDANNYPIDPAWYRRRLYNEFLERESPQRVLDVGCGGGQTVLDALQRGSKAEGIEPVPELVSAGKELLRNHKYDEGQIKQGDLSDLRNIPSGIYDCVSLLSVLPAIPFESWKSAHESIANVIKPGGSFIAAYRNQLFDLYTFNSFTMEFFSKELWGSSGSESLGSQLILDNLKRLVQNPDSPGAFHTNSSDKSFGLLQRPKSNPLTISAYLAQFGLEVERIRFCHFHCVPPLMQEDIVERKSIEHNMELTLSDDWRGNFMAAMILVEARKNI